jgi:uncharacterized protein YgbK (DUF1537 family)
MTNPRPPVLAYFGDDFTGSTDALEFLSRAGARTALFLEPPTPEQLKRYPHLDAVGVAGLTRSLGPEPMAAVLGPAFQKLRALGIRHLHYKVCSTFDSSPTIGSIGRAIEEGRQVFPEAPFVPLVVGAPALGRYCLFGNLFARMGIGSAGAIHRLDRHPSASRHPTTPADEADLLRHLAKQTSLPSALVDVLALALPLRETREVLEHVIAREHPAIVLFDALTEAHLTRVGELLEAIATPEAPLFSVGSSGVDMALGAAWSGSGLLQKPAGWPEITPAQPLLVLSGSRSPVTSGQIATALEAGFTEIALDTAALVRGEAEAERGAVNAAYDALKNGHSVIVHTHFKEDDSRGAATQEAFAARGDSVDSARGATAELFGAALGRIGRRLLESTSLRRVVLAGGDTSSFAGRALGLEAVEMATPFSPGAPLCHAFAPGSPADGIEINFKGGQVGAPHYFVQLRDGASARARQRI